jgi:hypothetical protein
VEKANILNVSLVLKHSLSTEVLTVVPSSCEQPQVIEEGVADFELEGAVDGADEFDSIMMDFFNITAIR